MTTIENGQFSITVPATATTLLISSAGFAPQEVAITGQADIAVTLLPSVTSNLS